MENNQLMVFQGHEVMILTKEDVAFEFKGDFLICAKDIKVILDYSRTEEITKFCKEDQTFIIKNNQISDTALNRIRKLNNAGEAFITNLALNRVLGKSEKPKAEPFQDWLYEDVVPSIQKTGGYVSNDELFINTYLPNADEQTRILFKQTLGVMKNQSDKISLLEPKADKWDEFLNSDGLIQLNEVAKHLNIGLKTFYAILRSEGILMKQKKPNVHIPTRKFETKGYFVVIREQVISKDNKLVWHSTTYATHQGFDFVNSFLTSYLEEESA